MRGAPAWSATEQADEDESEDRAASHRPDPMDRAAAPIEAPPPGPEASLVGHLDRLRACGDVDRLSVDCSVDRVPEDVQPVHLVVRVAPAVIEDRRVLARKDGGTPDLVARGAPGCARHG